MTLLPLLLGCPPAEVEGAPDQATTNTTWYPTVPATDTGPVPMGTGDIDAVIHTLQHWRDTDDVVYGTALGLWRTEPGGRQLVEVQGEGDYTALLQDPFAPDTYLASGDPPGPETAWGVIRSTDAGATWEELAWGGAVRLDRLAASRTTPGLVVAASEGQLHASSDGGATWTSVPFDLPVAGLEIVDDVGPVVLASTGSGVHRVDLSSGASELVLDGRWEGLDRFGDGLVISTGGGGAELRFCTLELSGCWTMNTPNSQPVTRMLDVPGRPEALWVLTVGSMVYYTDQLGSGWTLVTEGD